MVANAWRGQRTTRWNRFERMLTAAQPLDEAVKGTVDAGAAPCPREAKTPVVGATRWQDVQSHTRRSFSITDAQ